MKPRRQFIILGLFFLGGLVAFSNILNSWFLSDDFAQIGKVLSGDFSVVWGRAQGGFFRPLFILSYLVDTKIWGARPFGFHLTNVALHSLNAFLTFVLSLRILENLKLTAGAKRMIAIGAGALFLLHPSHTEAVVWISGRADLLATFFCLASLWSYLSLRSQQTPGTTGVVPAVFHDRFAGQRIRHLPAVPRHRGGIVYRPCAKGGKESPAISPGDGALFFDPAGVCRGPVSLHRITGGRIRRQPTFEFLSHMVTRSPARSLGAIGFAFVTVAIVPVSF